ncbi:tyrosine-type recombinase/integrase [Acidiphilium iwatense]|uniref:Tyrosine-type recombinase/integrase n=1 Tax=Acidiphilium iwatense TaxID=768198 RepID=A0ABS9DSX6_9PROT|nr:tyrosine-type recombinase/integrase [Acidiphilium iwatense]MCF3945787.1 tyrosine-type recombinase/integrase [Acidiphilium iwatense]
MDHPGQIPATPDRMPAVPDAGWASGPDGVPADRSAAARAALAAAIDFADQALAPATLRAYRSDWRHFCAWCAAAHWSPLPAAPETVAAYLAALAASHRASALVRRLAALGRAHRLAGQNWPGAHPAIRNTLRGIRRRHGRPPQQAAALMTDEVRHLVATCDHSLVGLRDRALLLLGYAGALRRAELVAIDHPHLSFDADGLRLLIPRAKGDPAGKGATLGIPRGTAPETCPVRAVESWLRASACRHGPVFRSIDRRGVIGLAALHPDTVRQILRKRAARAGLTVPAGERLSPHGLRAGFITQAYLNGARDEQIMDHTRQKDLRTMRGYVRRAKLVTESPVKLLGL